MSESATRPTPASLLLTLINRKRASEAQLPAATFRVIKPKPYLEVTRDGYNTSVRVFDAEYPAFKFHYIYGRLGLNQIFGESNLDFEVAGPCSARDLVSEINTRTGIEFKRADFRDERILAPGPFKLEPSDQNLVANGPLMINIIFTAAE